MVVGYPMYPVVGCSRGEIVTTQGSGLLRAVLDSQHVNPMRISHSLRLFFAAVFSLPGLALSALVCSSAMDCAGGVGGLGFAVAAVRVASGLAASAFKTRRPSLDVFMRWFS
jgi:hypothetical protein